MPEEAHGEFTPNWFSPPVDSLMQLMARRQVPLERVAAAIDGGTETLRALLAGAKSIDSRLAKAFASTVGGTERFWIARQENYDRALDTALLDAWREVDSWLAVVPAPGRRPPGHQSAIQKRAELRKRLAFYQVNSLKTWEMRYSEIRNATQFRTSVAYTSKEGGVSLWLRQGELAATLMKTESWNPNRLLTLVPEILRLSLIRKPNLFLPKLRKLCAKAGVAVVALRAPEGCRASGATRLISPNKAMILLSFRHLSDDHFWFTVLHEIGHLLLHGARSFVDTDETSADDQEREANDFARNSFIPIARWGDFESLPHTQNAILRFSVSLSIAPGVVVGQLQHQGLLPREKFNFLKRRWMWREIDAAIENQPVK